MQFTNGGDISHIKTSDENDHKVIREGMGYQRDSDFNSLPALY